MSNSNYSIREDRGEEHTSAAWSRTGAIADPHRCIFCGASPSDEQGAGHDAAAALLRFCQFVVRHPSAALAVACRVASPELAYKDISAVLRKVRSPTSANARQRVFALILIAVKKFPILETVLRTQPGPVRRREPLHQRAARRVKAGPAAMA